MSVSLGSLKDLSAAIKRPLTVSEVSAITDVDRKKVDRLIDDAVIPSTFVIVRTSPGRKNRERFLKPEACSLVTFSATTGDGVSSRMRKRVFAELPKLMKGAPAPAALKEGFLSLDLSSVVSITLERMEALATAEVDVVEDPDIRGGMPVLRGTRIGVHEIADLARSHSVAMLREDYPTLTDENIRNAVMYAKAHPQKGRRRKAADPEAGRTRITSVEVDRASP